MPTLRGRCVAFLEHLLIVVRQLLTGVHVTDGLDPDLPVIHDCIAVRITRMVDETRCVTANSSVYHRLVIDREQKCVMDGRFSSILSG